MALVTVNDDETEDFRSKPRWSASRKLDVVMRLLRGSGSTSSHVSSVSKHTGSPPGATSPGSGQRGPQRSPPGDRGRPAPSRRRAQDRRAHTRKRDLEEGGRKKGASDAAAEAAQVSAELQIPLALVCRITGASRSTIYERRSRGEVRCRPGPKCAIPDAEVTRRIHQVIAENPFCGEGHRKVRARLRREHELVVGKNRVLRLMREEGLLAPQRERRRRRPRVHDGQVTTE